MGSVSGREVGGHLLRFLGMGPLCLAFSLTFTFFAENATADYKLADQTNVIFDRIRTSDGLSPGAVMSIAQDHHGYIWIGTQEGLDRYDGYSFVTYHDDDEAPKSLLHDTVRALLADSQGRLWVGTDYGLNLFDHESESFSIVDLAHGEDSNERTTIFELLEDDEGNIWIGSAEGLAILSVDGQLKHFHHDPANPHSIGRGGVRSVLLASDRSVWVGTRWGGLFVLDRNSGRFQRQDHLPAQDLGNRDNYVRDLLEDGAGRVWIGNYGAGISLFDREKETWEQIRYERGRVGSISSNQIRALFEDDAGNIWIGSDGGVNLLKKSTSLFQHFSADVTSIHSLSDNFVVSFFQDKGGVVWVGTLDGINKWNAKVETFPHFRQTVTNETGLTSSSISSFAEAPNGDLWIGNYAGINHWSSETGRLESYSGEEIGLNDNRVMALLVDGDELLAGTMGGGLSVIRNGAVVRVYQNDPDDPYSLSSNAISKIYRSSENKIWITTYGGGVNQYLGNGQFRRYPDISNPVGTFPDLRCVDVREASDGRLWIATDGGGVVVLDPKNGQTHSYQSDPSDPTSISSDNTIAILVTDDGIWVGTRDRGINKFDSSTGEFHDYSKRDGLASDAVYGILKDSLDRIWISSGKGLSVLDPKTGHVDRYDSTHGTQGDDFNSGAYLALSDGTLIFGGTNGFNAFNPILERRNKYVPPVRLTAFSIFNKELGLPKDGEPIELKYDDSVVDFEFAALDYTAPEKNQYKYKLEGFNEDWVDAGNARQATYTNLDPGNYVFRVKGSNNDGVWNEEGTSIAVVVAPPLWATWWAYTIYTILAMALLYLLLQANARRQRLADEKRHAEQLQLYVESLEEATDCVLIADQDENLMYANDAINELLETTPGESLGTSMLDTLIQEHEDRRRVEEALRGDGRYHGEVGRKTNAGEQKTLEVTIAAVSQLTNERSGYVSISRDITERKRAEAELENYSRNLSFMVAEKTSALEKEVEDHKLAKKNIAESLEEKELLLKEVHHRVKNNMQVISSLLNIQAETVEDENLEMLLGESQQRIKSMSLIYENLYQSDNLLEIDFGEYINMLANSLCRFYTIPGVSVMLDVNVKDVSLDIETAVPCGLIINELVSNSLKHAFTPEKEVGTISISFMQVGCNYVLRIGDDGKGLPE